MEASVMARSAGEDMEFAACPRCGSSEGTIIVEGRDYLHGIEGCFFGWQCADCGLQYQNPRPTADRLVQLYPSDYAPHLARSLAGATAPGTPGWRAGLRWRVSTSSAWRLLRSVSVRLLHSFRYRTGIGFFPPTPDDMEVFLRQQMGYKHLKSPALSPGSSLSRRVIRECRRVAGIDLVPNYVPDGRLLEIGCATGDRLQSYSERGWENLAGIELTEQAATQAQQRGFSVVCEQVETALNKLPDGSFDVIVSSMVLEHLYDPFTVVRTIARKLKPGGQFLFSTVTLDGLDARWFGKYWGGYDFPRHMVYLRMADIHEMVSEDFVHVECFHQNAPIDFLRPAMWRAPEKKLGDRLIGRLAMAPVGLSIGELLARMGQTCRVSFRCRRK